MCIRDSQGVEHQKDGFVIRRNAIETGVNVLTSLDTAEALVTSLENTDANCLSLIAVSYTHLDVYKRQQIIYTYIIEVCNFA